MKCKVISAKAMWEQDNVGTGSNFFVPTCVQSCWCKPQCEHLARKLYKNDLPEACSLCLYTFLWWNFMPASQASLYSALHWEDSLQRHACSLPEVPVPELLPLASQFCFSFWDTQCLGASESQSDHQKSVFGIPERCDIAWVYIIQPLSLRAEKS